MTGIPGEPSSVRRSVPESRPPARPCARGCVITGLVAGAGAVRAGTLDGELLALTLTEVTAGWTSGQTAVSRLSFTIAPGSRTALVGPSGSGKSTVAALLVRFLDPRSGSVLLHGADLRDLDPAAVRRLVGYLPEDAYLFDTTIAENLHIGGPTLRIRQQRHRRRGDAARRRRAPRRHRERLLRHHAQREPGPARPVQP
jgi:ABC-type multidrug transport system fused ATPase/permease subunit